MSFTEQTFYLGLGSNLGNRYNNLKTAVEILISRANIFSWSVSSIYETEPVDYLNQPWFLNIVLKISFDIKILPGHFLAECLNIEKKFGRTRSIRYGERPLDIDILLCYQGTNCIVSNSICDGVEITLPHPRLHLRRFVLEPLCELCPNDYHPLLEEKFCDLVKKLPETPEVHIYNQTI